MNSPEDNPFAPTKAALSEPAAVAPEASPPTHEWLASRWRRLVNLLVDFGGFLMLLTIGTIPLSLYPPLLGALSGPGRMVYELAMFFLYYVSLESLTGRTLGKFLTRTRVVSATGHPPTFGQVMMRTVLRLIPFEPFTFFARGPGLHDRGSRTRVVLNRYGE